jgi:hypothetical protein
LDPFRSRRYFFYRHGFFVLLIVSDHLSRPCTTRQKKSKEVKVKVSNNEQLPTPTNQSSFILGCSIMALSLRRSRRATKKGISEFNEGDIVEVRSACIQLNVRIVVVDAFIH